MVFNATFNNILVILWRSVLLVKETRVPGENDRSVGSHGQTTGRWFSPVSCCPKKNKLDIHYLHILNMSGKINSKSLFETVFGNSVLIILNV